MDLWDMPMFTTFLDIISVEFVPKIRDLWTAPHSRSAIDNAQASLLFVVTNVEEDDARTYLFTQPFSPTILNMPTDHNTFVQYIADLFKFKRLRFRASRFQVTAHGEVDGKHLSVMLHLSNYRARTLVPTLHVPYSLVYTFSQDYPYFEHVWTSMVANTDGNQLISVTTFADLLQTIKCPWALRGRWVVAREMRLLLPNVKEDGDVPLTHNQVSHLHPCSISHWCSMLHMSLTLSNYHSPSPITTTTVTAEAHPSLANALTPPNQAGKEFPKLLGIMGNNKKDFLLKLFDRAARKCAASLDASTILQTSEANLLKSLIDINATNDISLVDKEGGACDPTKVVRWLLKLLLQHIDSGVYQLGFFKNTPSRRR